MLRIVCAHTYDDIISQENLLSAWQEFLRGKRKRGDVQTFQYQLFDNIANLHTDLTNKTYRHGPYEAFNISDPKPRHIHKATVRDRLLHHALYRQLYPFFDRTFVADSYSCRRWKGTHRAMDRFRSFAYKVSKNHTRTSWVLKCDIRRFFASINQPVLMSIVRRYIPSDDSMWLIGRVVYSFNSGTKEKGLPLGNLTSQLLVNIYMNEFDQFVKHGLKTQYYIRYADDFVVLSHKKERLVEILPYIEAFLRSQLRLELHSGKVSIKTFSSGVDFLGWVHFPSHRVLRTTTKGRMLKRISGANNEAAATSYLGLLSHGNAQKLSAIIKRLNKKKNTI